MSDVTAGSLAHRSSAFNADAVFNLLVEKDVIQLLQRIHQSTLTPEEKNTLRDALFSFRQTQKKEIAKELLHLFSRFGFTICAGDTDKTIDIQSSVDKQKTKNTNYVGSTRPQPVFKNVGVVKADEDICLESQTNTVISSKKQTIAKEDLSQAQKLPTTSPPIPTTDIQSTDNAIKQKPQEETVEEKVVTHTPLQQHVVTGNALERIKEIKKQVNTLVGNPVNLIDVHNEIGREYMNALLDAMKKNNGGSSQEMSLAMERLEKAFVLVQQTVQKDAVTNKVTEAPATVEHTPVDTEVDNVPPQTQRTGAPVKETASAQAETPQADMSISDTATETQPTGFASVHQTHIEQTKNTSDSTQAVVTTASTPVAPQQQTQINTANTASTMVSVAKEKQIQELLVSEKQEAALTDAQREEARIASLDPLMTPEVTSGLQQLLSEWSLFKSSGIFGTGGSGMEHPLYKKLAGLNMTAIVAGRYEGATPQIKRSISDYMNGWRYEEGILQEQGENFEHYLRRVIKHILDKRKK